MDIPALNTTTPSLAKFFHPQGIVIIGASTDTKKLGYSIARNLIEIGFPGTVHFVNPHGGQLFGRPIYTCVMQVPDPVDLSVLLIPAAATPQVLSDCGKRGIQAAIIVASGFRETGPEGARLESELLNIAKRYKIRIIGPNCIGLVDTHLPIDTSFLNPPPPPKGNIAFISHSGATCAAVIDWSRGQGFGFSRLVSLGNQIDVNETDLLLAIAPDPATQAIALYLESVSNGRRFVKVARNITRYKPVVVLKSGRNTSGQRAAASHTGALAGQDAAYEAAFLQTGIIRANTVEELFEWAYTLASCPLPKGRSMAVLTSAGGLGVAAVDALEANGLKLAELTDTTRTNLNAILPPAANIHNPVDMLASATPEQFASCLKLLIADPQVEGILMVILPPPFATDMTVSQAVLPIIKNSPKPVLTALVGELLIQADLAHFQQAQIPEFRFPERAASAMSALVKRMEYLERAISPAEPNLPVDRAIIQELIRGNQPGKYQKILNAIGIISPPTELARNCDEVEEVLNRIGLPVALKIASPDLLHKSDIGGVLLNIQDLRSAQEGYEYLVNKVQSSHPKAYIQGVSIQRMAPYGQEVILGMLQDSIFGSIVMFGSGGIEVEGIKDVAFALTPLTPTEAENLIDRTWAGRKLRGYRSIAPADRQAVIKALVNLSQLAVAFPGLLELEINPLRVLPVGEGVLALDIRAKSS